MDRDGIRDLMIALIDISGVAYLRGRGDGTFRAPVVVASLYGNNVDVAAPDVNRDGDLDLAVLSFSSAFVFLNDGDAGFGAAADGESLGIGQCIEHARIDGNARPDLVASIAGTPDTLKVLRNDGGGKFSVSASEPIPDGIACLDVADFDRDGFADIAVAAYNHNQPEGDALSVVRGKGDGSLYPSEEFVVPGGPRDVAATRLDGNRRPDLVVSGFDADSVAVLLDG